MLQLLTISDLASRTGEPEHVVNYAVKRYGPKPSQRLGIVRLWIEDDLPAIRASIDRTAQKGRSRSPLVIPA